ncbi:S-adenosylhomocysteine hydrolase [Pseudomonas syringae]|uniref:S-adenosylhomocysteine hydrolase n=1 Tax=Pseudomonas syringae pv. coriandricola TaxID=264453 RepID=A0A3M4U6K7_9PSED|nr:MULTISPECIES: DUF6088 family protein [Pseudomonas syringae group]EPM43143.1 hypothetical protein A262_28362 [Pseudomonas syringae pv. actinidiae ICMP 19073]MBS7426456.1 S-adenosylhomocysteine hydrolase [Pseudomonas syringae]MBS7432477.1 S-adenosylhomocysteine hydrolase [Pseudomonas syringae]QVI82411.1 S-adenosylhomocysteine hydrolase [Pseudomonas syringae]RMO81780.1 hypothetical protein ALQ34_101825 [Pseudomonas syringae pv. maculicola]
MKLEDRMSRSIKQRTSIVVLRSDFSKMGSDSQVGRVLARFVENGVLVRVSKGAFAKTRINQYTGKPTPAGTLEMIAAELFSKLKISIAPSTLVAEYNSGKSTQIPMGTVVNTGRRRISRKVIVGSNAVVYENSVRAAAG